VNDGVVAENRSISIFPNPANASATLRYDLDGKATSIAVLDVTGREVERVNEPQNATSLDLNTEGWASGEYYVIVRNSKGIRRARLTVQH
jgi:hypothetical protein